MGSVSTLPPLLDGPQVEEVSTSAYTIPTDTPEADGTFAWRSTTMVCVELTAAGCTGLGWTYAPAPCAGLIAQTLAPRLIGLPAFAIPRCVRVMSTAIRDFGQVGLASYAESAVDVALWDLKARLLDVPLAALLGLVHDEVAVYGSGGFVTYDTATMTAQLRGWLEAGMGAVKIKIGERGGGNVRRDLARVGEAKQVLGDAALFVDANGGYRRKQAIQVGRSLEAYDVAWFEEPVTSDDKEGLARASTSLDLDVAAGEYADDVYEMRRLCEVVDCLQVDVTRCGGITGWLRAAAIASSYGLDVSGHCAPHAHLAAAAATQNVRHLEWFHDHARIECRFLDGAEDPQLGRLRARSPSIGHGYRLKEPDLAPYRVA
ncbi:MAG: enolase C-terminal domain-like protein [Nocardioides sp.]|uniref:enolase C-terminal domain-like protein n=1 Tax=Nocardioides sp. TaxID=35761 RepID=UPI0039E44F8F